MAALVPKQAGTHCAREPDSDGRASDSEHNVDTEPEEQVTNNLVSTSLAAAGSTDALARFQKRFDTANSTHKEVQGVLFQCLF